MIYLLGRLNDEFGNQIRNMIKVELGLRGYTAGAPFWEKHFPGGMVSVVPGLVSFQRRKDGTMYLSMTYTMGNYILHHTNPKISFWDRLIPGRLQRIITRQNSQLNENISRMMAELTEIRSFIEAIQVPSLEGVRALRYECEGSDGLPESGELMYFADEEARLNAEGMLSNNFLIEEDHLALEARCS